MTWTENQFIEPSQNHLLCKILATDHVPLKSDTIANPAAKTNINDKCPRLLTSVINFIRLWSVLNCEQWLSRYFTTLTEKVRYFKSTFMLPYNIIYYKLSRPRWRAVWTTWRCGRVAPHGWAWKYSIRNEPVLRREKKTKMNSPNLSTLYLSIPHNPTLSLTLTPAHSLSQSHSHSLSFSLSL